MNPVLTLHKEQLVLVSEVAHDGKFFVQLDIDEAYGLPDLSTRIGQLAKTLPVLSAPAVAMRCYALSVTHDQWFRGVIANLKAPSCLIFYVDYGNVETLPLTNLRHASDVHFATPYQAVCCQLIDFLPTDGDWSVAFKSLQGLIMDKELTLVFHMQDSALQSVIGLPCYRVTALDSTSKLSIARKLVDEGLGQYCLTRQSIEVGTSGTAIVSYCESPDRFWVQLTKGSGGLDELMESLNNPERLAKLHQIPFSALFNGVACCVSYDEDGRFYRGEITKATASEVTVLYADYGNSTVVAPSSVLQLSHDFVALPVQALQCQLDGAEQARGVAAVWSESDIQLFADQCSAEEFDIVFGPQVVPGVYKVTLSSSVTGSLASWLVKHMVGNAGAKAVPSLASKDTGNTSQGVTASSQSATKPSSQLPSQPSTKPPSQPPSQPSTKPPSQPPSQPSSRPPSQPPSQPSTKPPSQPPSQPSSRSPSQPPSQPSSRPPSQPPSQPSSRPPSQPPSQPSSRPPSQPPSQPSTRPPSQPPSQPSSQSSSQLPSRSSSQTPSTQPAHQHPKQPNTPPVTTVKPVGVAESPKQHQPSVISAGRPQGSSQSTPLPDATHAPFAALLRSKYPSLSFQPQEESVYVFHAESPSAVWCQLVANTELLMQLMDNIAMTYAQVKDKYNLPIPPRVGQPCCLQYREDESWCRGLVIGLHDNKQPVEAEVLYVDYGSVERVAATELKELFPQFLVFPAQAVCVRLHGVFPTGGGSQWSPEAIARLVQMSVRNDNLRGTWVTGAPKDGCQPSVRLSIQRLDIADILVKEGLAEYRDGSSCPAVTPVVESIAGMYPALQLKKGQVEMVAVSHVTSLSDFYCQLLANEEKLDILTAELQEFAESCSPQGPVSLKVNVPVLAKYSVDGMWYRARVLAHPDKDSYTVLFVDFGNVDTAKGADLIIVPPSFLSVPVSAVKCSLAGSFETLPLAAERFEELSTVATFQCTVVDVGESYSVELQHDGEDLLKLLEKDGCIRTKKSTLVERSAESAKGNDAKSSQKPVPPGAAAISPQSYPVQQQKKVQQKMEVTISHVNSVGEFYCQCVSDVDTVDTLTRELQEYADSSCPQKVASPILNMPVLAKYSVDEMWYRALISAHQGADHCTVFFVDFGNTDTVLVDDLVCVPASFLSVQPYAFKCALEGCHDITDGAQSLFTELAVSETFTCTIKGIGLNGSYTVELKTGTKDLLYQLKEAESSKAKVPAAIVDSIPQQQASVESVNSRTSQSSGGSQAASQTAAAKAGPVVQVSHPLQTPGVMSPPSFPVNQWCEGSVSYLKSPSLFYVQLVSNMSMLTKLATALNEVSSKSLLNPQLGSLCCARFTEDKLWYRACITSLSGGKGITVLYLDYGNSEVLELSSLRILGQDFIAVPPLSIPCQLDDLEVSEPLPKQMVEEFAELVEDKALQVMFLSSSASTDSPVHVRLCLEKGISVSEHLNGKFGTRSLNAPSIVSVEPPLGTPTTCFVPYIEDLNTFYCQLASNCETLQQLADKLQDFYTDQARGKPLERAAVGSLCVALFDDDSCWYRAKVTQLEPLTATVYFVDYGNSTDVCTEELKTLEPGFATVPIQAITCSLRGAKPTGGVWSEEEVANFDAAVMNVPVTVTFSKSSVQGNYEVTIAEFPNWSLSAEPPAQQPVPALPTTVKQSTSPVKLSSVDLASAKHLAASAPSKQSVVSTPRQSSKAPSPVPSAVPSKHPAPVGPSPVPSAVPSKHPTPVGPSPVPSPVPSAVPSKHPTPVGPSPVPSAVPSKHPTPVGPSPVPSAVPSKHPTPVGPSPVPSAVPSKHPTPVGPSPVPSAVPSKHPTPVGPSPVPSAVPSKHPTPVGPSPVPSAVPSKHPTPVGPSAVPSKHPTPVGPSPVPSAVPSKHPTPVGLSPVPTSTTSKQSVTPAGQSPAAPSTPLKHSATPPMQLGSSAKQSLPPVSPTPLKIPTPGEIARGSKHKVMVVTFHSPDDFYCTAMSSTALLGPLMEEINHLYAPNVQSLSTAKGLEPGMTVLAQFTDDNVWYRAKIVNVDPTKDTVQVWYIDYGNKEGIPASRLKLMDQRFMSLEPQCVKCQLHNPKGHKWSDSMSSDLFHLITEKGVLTAEFVLKKGEVWEVNLFDGEANILQAFVPISSSEQASLPTAVTVPSSTPPSSTVPSSTPPSSTAHLHLPSAVALVATNAPPQTSPLPMKHQVPSPKLVAGSIHAVYLTAVISPAEFWCQSVNSDQFDALVVAISEYCSSDHPVPRMDLVVGDYCLAYDVTNEEWCRAKVVSVDASRSSASVLMVDYGNTQEVGVAEVLALSQEFALQPAQAFRCRLDHSKTSQQEMDWFQALDLEQEYCVKIVSIEGDGYVVDLRDHQCTRITTKCTSEARTEAPPPSVIGYKRLQYDMGTRLDVFVSHVESPSSFFCQPLELAEDLDAIMMDLKAAMEGESPLGLGKEGVVSSRACAARYSDDGEWYRARVEQVMDGDQVLVDFVDYGNSELTSLDGVAVLPAQFLSVPVQAMECSILEPSGDHVMWTDDQLDRFASLVQDPEHVTLHLLKASKDGRVAHVKVFNGDQEIDFSEFFNLTKLSQKVTEMEAEKLPSGEVQSQSSVHVPLPSSINIVRSKSPSTEGETESEGAEGEPLIKAPFQLNLVVKETTEARVVFICNPNLIYIQRVDCEDELDALSSEVEEYCANFAKVQYQKTFTPGDFVLACYAVDSMWYRAKVQKVLSDTCMEVFFIDYGNTEQISPVDMVMCPENFLELPVQAIPCSLAFVPNRDSWPADYKTLLSDLVDGRILKMTVEVPSSQGMIPSVSLVGLEETGGEDISNVVLHQLQMECDTNAGTRAAIEDHPPVATEDVNPPAATEDVNPPAETEDVNPPAATEDVNPPAATEDVNPPAATEDVNPPAATEDVNPPAATDVSPPATAEEAEPAPPAISIPQALTIGQQYTVKVSKLSSLYCFSCTVVDDPVFSKVQRCLSELYVETGGYSLTTPPQEGDYVCARSIEDGQWYRAEVERIESEGSYAVWYVDYGIGESLPVSVLRMLDQKLLGLPCCRVDCFLSGVDDSVLERAEANMDDVCKLIGEESVIIVADTVDDNGVYGVTMTTPSGVVVNSAIGSVQTDASGTVEEDVGAEQQPVTMVQESVAAIPLKADTRVPEDQVHLSDSMIVVDLSESAEKFVLVERGVDGEDSLVQNETPICQGTEPNQPLTAITKVGDASEHVALQPDEGVCEGRGPAATSITATRTPVRLVSANSLEDFVCIPLTEPSGKASPDEIRCAFPLLTERDLDLDFPPSKEPWELSWPSSAEQHFFEIVKDKEQFELEVIGPAEEDGCVLVKLVWNSELDVRDAIVAKIRDRGQSSLQSLEFENIVEDMIEGEGVDYLEGIIDEDTAVEEESIGQYGGDHSPTDGGGDYMEGTADTVGATHEQGEDKSEVVVTQECDLEKGTNDEGGHHMDLIFTQENAQDDDVDKEKKENDCIAAGEGTVEESNTDVASPCKEKDVAAGEGIVEESNTDVASPCKEKDVAAGEGTVEESNTDVASPCKEKDVAAGEGTVEESNTDIASPCKEKDVAAGEGIGTCQEPQGIADTTEHEGKLWDKGFCLAIAVH